MSGRVARGDIEFSSVSPRATRISQDSANEESNGESRVGTVHSHIKSAEQGHQEQGKDSSSGQETPTSAPPNRKQQSTTGLLGACIRVFTALCLVISLVHVSLVFLHVAPPNPLSQEYGKQINAWVYPLFEQNWRLFAPNPESVNRQLSARTAHTDKNGTMRVSAWFDLTGVDNAATEHNPFPSHTTQNLLRRAWTSYIETHGGDDQSRTERALMIRTYLRNIAVDRVTAHRPGPFESIQLRVITLPITASTATDDRPQAASSRPAPVDTRYLPWWKVTSRAT